METIDTFYDEKVKLVQARNGYRYSLDPVLLADFVTLHDRERSLDLGTGCGVLPLLLARRSPSLHVIGWELQPQMVERARRGVELSAMTGQISIVQADLREHRRLAAAGSFGLVVSNPPYRSQGTGRIAPDGERAAARHELAGGLGEFLAAAGWCLRSGGRFAIVYLADRLSELLVGMAAVGIEPKRLRVVHSRRAAVGRIVLVEGRKDGRPGLEVESPLYIYRENGEGSGYTDEVLRMYGKPGIGFTCP